MDHDGNRNVNDEKSSSMPRLMFRCCWPPTKMMTNEDAEELHLTYARAEPSSAAAVVSGDRAMNCADSGSISDAPQMELNRDTCSLDD